MLDLKQYESLGAALTAATERWPNELCLIEADRERERCRLTYAEFAKTAQPLAAALEESGFAAGDRAAILMTNQSKWLISAFAVFYAGGTLVPLDYKLTAPEHLALLAHSKARVLIVEYPLWRAICHAEGSYANRPELVLVTEAPAEADLSGASRNFAHENVPTQPASSIPQAQAAVPRAASSPTEITSSSARPSLRSFPSGPERATSASFLPTTRSTSWAASSCLSPAAAPSCICARCALNTSAKPSPDTKSPTWLSFP
jgi:acyl-CoA synthetase (AMP-forming)/AMP-acid ligase II